MSERKCISAPRFGARVTNLIAGETNPTRVGYFVRAGRNTGRMNHGPWWECTDGRGKFWRLDPVLGRLPAHLPDPHLIVDRSTELPFPAGRAA